MKQKLSISIFALVVVISLLAIGVHQARAPKSAVAPAVSKPSAPATPSTAIQEKEAFDKQVAADKAKAEAEQKAKDDAVKDLDNKHPKDISDSDDQILLTALFSETTAAQAEFANKQQQANAFLAGPRAHANDKAKELLDTLKEFQKSHHAQGCDLTPPKIEVVKGKKKQTGLTWDCSHAAELVAAEGK